MAPLAQSHPVYLECPVGLAIRLRLLFRDHPSDLARLLHPAFLDCPADLALQQHPLDPEIRLHLLAQDCLAVPAVQSLQQLQQLQVDLAVPAPCCQHPEHPAVLPDQSVLCCLVFPVAQVGLVRHLVPAALVFLVALQDQEAPAPCCLHREYQSVPVDLADQERPAHQPTRYLPGQSDHQG